MIATTLDVSNRSHGAEDGTVRSGESSDKPLTFFPHTLTIKKDNSNTTVSESASSAAVGSGGSVLFTANVASYFEALVPAGESVRSMRFVVVHCDDEWIGVKSCSMSNGSLASGNYAGTTYASDSNNTIANAVGATSATSTLVVTA
jgi:hypothetical protein